MCRDSPSTHGHAGRTVALFPHAIQLYPIYCTLTKTSPLTIRMINCERGSNTDARDGRSTRSKLANQGTSRLNYAPPPLVRTFARRNWEDTTQGLVGNFFVRESVSLLIFLFLRYILTQISNTRKTLRECKGIALFPGK